MSKLTEILAGHMPIHPDHQKDRAAIEKEINAYIAEVIGEDEPKLYDHDGDIAEHRNQLRAEQRKRAGL